MCHFVCIFCFSHILSMAKAWQKTNGKGGLRDSVYPLMREIPRVSGGDDLLADKLEALEAVARYVAE
ncbi:hypothetical protein GCM10011315_00710 [Roseovarius pacificus]|nr:hypothetical protein GCM10011315_00710 [Roseovarius pacificus]